jgi:ketosteroid isomerase-like protein
LKPLLSLLLLTSVSAISAFAQTGNAEREIKSFLAQYEQAVLKRDIAFFERVLTDGYTYSSSNGTRESRTQALEYWRRERDKPTYKIASFSRENLSVRLLGDTAVVTQDLTVRTLPADNPPAEPRIDSGISTMVLQKRGGYWKVVTEHESERPRDQKLMEQQVLKAGREYNDLMIRLKSGRDYAALLKQGDIAALERLLADEYIYTSREGEVSSKAQDLESYKTIQIKNYSAEHLNQEVRVIGDNAAVETGTVRYKGLNKGVPFDITKRYTTTWVWRGFQWQIVADHTSQVKQ